MSTIPPSARVAPQCGCMAPPPPCKDVIAGGDGDDLINGGRNSDTLSGDTGNDTFTWETGDGTDNIDGGFGWDQIVGLLPSDHGGQGHHHRCRWGHRQSHRR